MDIYEGSVVEYQPFGGGRRRVTVENHYDDIKNGRPGFDGVTDDGQGVWGYDDQVTRVIA